MKNSRTILYYIHDPMCSWCWGFKATFQELSHHLGDDVEVERILGGLAADTDEPMPESMREQVQGNWKRVELSIPGIRFNYDFWSKCQPRRATYAACRAVIAARQQGQQYDELMTSAIQKAYYQQARNPSDDQVLIKLASELGLDKDIFVDDFYSDETRATLQQEIDLALNMFVESLPSLVLEINDTLSNVEIDYTNYRVMLKQVQGKIDAVR